MSVLDQWLERNQTYDVALRNLYKAISKVGKKVTAATKAAVKAEAAARARLPPDTRGLIIIMSEIGRGGMNGAVIAIEEARAKLADAIDAGTAAPSDGDPASRPTAAPDRSRPARLHCAQHPAHRPVDPSGPEAVRSRRTLHPCSFVSSPISRGTCPRMSSSCPSPPSRPSTARSASSTGGPAASSPRSSRSAS